MNSFTPQTAIKGERVSTVGWKGDDDKLVATFEGPGLPGQYVARQCATSVFIIKPGDRILIYPTVLSETDIAQSNND